MAINTCDFCNNDAVVRFMINDLPGAESCACAVHKEEAEKRVDGYNKPEIKTIEKEKPATVPVGDNGKVFHRTVVGDLPTLEEPVNKSYVEYMLEQNMLAISDDQAEKLANRLWQYLQPKVLKEMKNLLDKEPIMSPDGSEIRGWVDRAPWQEPVIDIDHRRVDRSPQVDIMDRYGLWTDNQFEDHCSLKQGYQSEDRRCANDQLAKTREVLKGFIYGKENKEVS